MDVDIKNESNYDFSDISSEKYRVYDFGKNGEVVIDNPQALAVSDNGHRIVDGDGTSHYVKYGWKHLHWETEEDEPHFVK
jgi:hypothetical protein